MSVMSAQALSIREEAGPREFGMSLLLAALMALNVAEQVFALPLSLGPGLSAENALLYVVLAALLFKMAVQRTFRFELRELHVCFVVLIAYAALSIIAAAVIMQYPGYRVVSSIIAFKARLVDQFVFFAVFFYGLHQSRSAYNVLKMVLVFMIAANLIALLDAWGYMDAAGLEERDDGRAQGVMGESNQTAAFIASFLPAIAGLAFMSSGVARLFWAGGTFVAATALIISASRGGLVALVLASIWGLVRFRKYISGRAIMGGVAVAGAVAVVVLPFVAARYGSLLMSRFIGDSSSVDMVDVSSGRLDIWAGAFAVMAQSPLTFLSGFGWNVYSSMPFRLAPHNHYVALWFELGLVGLVCGTALLVLAARAALNAVPLVSNQYRGVMMSFAIGTLAIAIATFFVDLYTPWLWFWAYAGLVMRIAVNARSNVRAQVSDSETVGRPAVKADMFGWVGTAARR